MSSRSISPIHIPAPRAATPITGAAAPIEAQDRVNMLSSAVFQLTDLVRELQSEIATLRSVRSIPAPPPRVVTQSVSADDIAAAIAQQKADEKNAENVRTDGISDILKRANFVVVAKSDSSSPADSIKGAKDQQGSVTDTAGQVAAGAHLLNKVVGTPEPALGNGIVGKINDTATLVTKVIDYVKKLIFHPINFVVDIAKGFNVFKNAGTTAQEWSNVVGALAIAAAAAALILTTCFPAAVGTLATVAGISITVPLILNVTAVALGILMVGLYVKALHNESVAKETNVYLEKKLKTDVRVEEPTVYFGAGKVAAISLLICGVAGPIGWAAFAVTTIFARVAADVAVSSTMDTVTERLKPAVVIKQ